MDILHKENYKSILVATTAQQAQTAVELAHSHVCAWIFSTFLAQTETFIKIS